MKFGFLTTDDLSEYFYSSAEPLLTHDDFALAEWLHSKGHEVVPIPWGQGDLSDANLDHLIIRSPWDYMKGNNPSRFFEWLQLQAKSKVSLHNPFAVVKWNFDKHYLADLDFAGVPCIPTEYVETTDILNKDFLLRRLKKGPFVLKPCISAGAKDTFLMQTDLDILQMNNIYGAIPDDFEAWRNSRSFMIQPFIESVRDRGEWSLVYLNGHYSHAVHKLPKTGGWLVQDELGGSVYSKTPPENIFPIAESALHAVNSKFDCHLLYARIDIMLADDVPFIGELELIEPELFFKNRNHDGSQTINIAACEKFLEYFLN